MSKILFIKRCSLIGPGIKDELYEMGICEKAIDLGNPENFVIATKNIVAEVAKKYLSSTKPKTKEGK